MGSNKPQKLQYCFIWVKTVFYFLI